MNEFRHQPLYDQWVIIAQNRVKKPSFSPVVLPSETISSPFVMGSEHKTPPEIYALRENPRIVSSWKTRVFANKFPLLALESPLSREKYGAYSTIGAFGAHEMIIDSQKPSKHFCEFTKADHGYLLQSFRDRVYALYQDSRIKSISLYKNQGYKAGNTIPHSHSQIVALPFISPTLDLQIENSRRHYNKNERCLMCDLMRDEETSKERVLFRNKSFVIFAPFAPRYEFEVWIAPISHKNDFSLITREEINELAEALEWVLTRMDIALEKPDLNMLIFTAPPVREHKDPDYFHHLERFFHWHIELLPRFSGCDGFELNSGCFINPIAPEKYAKHLKEITIKPQKEVV